MGQLIRIILVLVGIWLVVHYVRRALNRRRENTPGQRRIDSTRMLACEHCGTHVPEADALLQDGKPYCCPEHLRAARRERD